MKKKFFLDKIVARKFINEVPTKSFILSKTHKPYDKGSLCYNEPIK